MVLQQEVSMHISKDALLAGFALFAVLILAAGCTSPEGGQEGGEASDGVPATGANDTGIGEGGGEVAGMNATVQECTPSNRTLEAYSEGYAGESGEQSTVVEEACGNVSWAFEPPILAAKKIRREEGVEYKFNRINLSGSEVVFAVLNETAVAVGKEREHMFINPYPGCEEARGEGDNDTFTLGGRDYGYKRVLSLDVYGAMFEDVNQTRNFTISFGELYDSGDGIVFLWKTAPGMQACASWAEISVFEEAAIINVGEGEGEATIILSEEENVQEGPIYEYPGSVFEDEIRLAYVSVPGELVE
jgi:hypothetical protein